MYSRPCLSAMRCRLSSQIRLRSEPSTSRESNSLLLSHYTFQRDDVFPGMRSTFVDTVLKGHSKALEEMESEIVLREEMRIKDLQKSEVSSFDYFSFC